MRGARRVLLLAITAILVSVGTSYYVQRAKQEREAPPPPAELPPNIEASSTNWVHTEYEAGKPKVEIRATRMRQIREPSQFELEGVELRIFTGEGKQYDRVRCGQARFDLERGTLYSEGEVEITLAVPEQGPPETRLLTIRSSGVRFDTATGKATTDRPASFIFDRGEGRCVGATYDPGWRDLRMHGAAHLRWNSEEPGGEAMEVDAGQLVYKEDQSRVYLSPWSRFTRGQLTLEAGDSVVTLERGAIRVVQADNARGHSTYPSRRVDYAAGHLILNFTPDGAMEKIVGERDAKVVAVAPTGETTVTGAQVFLEFKPAGEDSFLDNVLAMGKGTLISRPASRPGEPAPATKILRSEVIKTIMRPGGEEIQTIETEAPGTVEFLPNSPAQKHRRLEAERMWIHYGFQNRIRSFRAAKAATRTESGPGAGQKSAPPILTWSDDLLAGFEPATGEMTRMEQWGDFRYERGARQARADKAVMDATRNLITLDGKARLWDEAGSTSADHIVLNQAEGVSTAAGHVTSSRLPGSAGSSGGMISGNEPLDATAERMTATADGSYIVYEGNTVVWQGSSRLRADRVEIDRQHRTLVAKGRVSSEFLDQNRVNHAKDSAGRQAGFYTRVESGQMRYMEEHRVIHYEDAVHLRRPGLEVTSSRLEAFLKSEDGAQSSEDTGPSLDHVLADGAVNIVLKDPERTRTGIAEHAEYYADEDKVILRGGRPKMIDTLRGTTRGTELTYYGGSDTLLVDGAESRPAVSRLRRR